MPTLKVKSKLSMVQQAKEGLRGSRMTFPAARLRSKYSQTWHVLEGDIPLFQFLQRLDWFIEKHFMRLHFTPSFVLIEWVFLLKWSLGLIYCLMYIDRMVIESITWVASYKSREQMVSRWALQDLLSPDFRNWLYLVHQSIQYVTSPRLIIWRNERNYIIIKVKISENNICFPLTVNCQI